MGKKNEATYHLFVLSLMLVLIYSCGPHHILNQIKDREFEDKNNSLEYYDNGRLCVRVIDTIAIDIKSFYRGPIDSILFVNTDYSFFDTNIGYYGFIWDEDSYRLLICSKGKIVYNEYFRSHGLLPIFKDSFFYSDNGVFLLRSRTSDTSRLNVVRTTIHYMDGPKETKYIFCFY